ncbi:Insulin-degrading enzyme [Coccomyxa sp. Obi]|nr:Insulin-degrading enzyme [Coccomyxa sp. Obi]
MGLGRSEASQEIIKPLSFKAQQFKRIVLDNKLEFLLVSDPELDKAGAAVDVRVGSLLDPQKMPGLAHFCEHMLFYASEKYPEEDAYSKFLSEHGGHTNAYTAAESTNYHFDCNWDSLEEALDRFAQFFISPLISEDGVEREVNAVDSEHNKNLNTDAWRTHQLWRHTANPGNPFNRFSTGNLDTLLHTPKDRGLVPHREVQEFHARHYSSNLMRGAVVGPQPIAELEALVRAKFGAVPNTDLQVPTFPGDVLTEQQTGQLLRVVPQKEGHRLDLQWAVPPEQHVYRSTPCGYLGHLLGHEGFGSPFAVLKARGWATELSAGEGGSSFSARSFFTVGINLTDEGMEHVEEIVAIIFAYVKLVSEQDGVTADRFQQYRALAQLRFNFSDKQGPLAMAQYLSSKLQEVPAQDVLLALHNVPQEFNEAAVRAVLKELTPRNLRIMLSSKRFKGQTKSVEPWYGTEYSQEPISQEWLGSWTAAAATPDLHLPHDNPFISSDFTLIDVKDTDETKPAVCHESPLLRMWHKPSTRFDTPKAVIYLHFACPEAYTSPEAAVLTRLFVKLLSDYLNEIAYDAELAGLSWGLNATKSGFLVSFFGYSHKLMELVRQVLDRIGSFEVQHDRFQVQKEAVAKEYANARYQQPYQTAMYETAVLFEAQRWHTNEYEAVIGDLQPVDLTAFMGRLTSRCFAEGYATGNFNSEQASHLTSVVEGLLKERLRARPLFSSQRPQKRVLRLAAGAPALLSVPAPNEENDNSAVVLTYQVGPDDLARNALAELAVQCCRRDAFHTLRTVEQLGYMVWLAGLPTLTVRAVAFVVQSAAFGAAHLEARCEAFVAAQTARLADMDAESFASQVEELAKAKLEKPKRLRELAAREWREIDDGTLVFGRPAAEVAALRTLTKSDVLQFFQDVLLDVKSRRKLAVHIVASSKAAAPAVAADGCANSAADSSTNGASPGQEAGSEGVVANGSAPGATEETDKEPNLGGQDVNSQGGASTAEGSVAVHVIEDVWAFKRAQEVYPSPK